MHFYLQLTSSTSSRQTELSLRFTPAAKAAANCLSAQLVCLQQAQAKDSITAQNRRTDEPCALEQLLHSAHILMAELGFIDETISMPCLYFLYSVERGDRLNKSQLMSKSALRRSARKAVLEEMEPGVVSSADGAQRLLDALREQSQQVQHQPELPQAAEAEEVEVEEADLAFAS